MTTIRQDMAAPGAGGAHDNSNAGNANGTNGLILPDNTEKPARRPGEGRKYFSFSQYTKYGMCGEMYRRVGGDVTP